MGSSLTSCPFTTLPTTPDWVSTWTAVACTSTVSPIPPTGNLIGTVVMSLTCSSTFFVVTFLNPCLVTLTLYTPGFSSGKLNDPSDPVVVDRLPPPLVWGDSTLALGRQ